MPRVDRYIDAHTSAAATVLPSADRDRSTWTEVVDRGTCNQKLALGAEAPAGSFLKLHFKFSYLLRRLTITMFSDQELGPDRSNQWSGILFRRSCLSNRKRTQWTDRISWEYVASLGWSHTHIYLDLSIVYLLAARTDLGSLLGSTGDRNADGSIITNRSFHSDGGIYAFDRAGLCYLC